MDYLEMSPVGRIISLRFRILAQNYEQLIVRSITVA